MAGDRAVPALADHLVVQYQQRAHGYLMLQRRALRELERPPHVIDILG